MVFSQYRDLVEFLERNNDSLAGPPYEKKISKKNLSNAHHGEAKLQYH